MSTGEESVDALLRRARDRELPLGVCGGRLWIQVSGEQLELLHLASSLLVREAQVLVALGVAPPPSEYDAEYHWGAEAAFADDIRLKLVQLRDKLARSPSTADGPVDE